VTSTTVNSYMADAAAQLRICAESGVNAVTLSEEALFPWHTSPDIAEELDRIAKQNGVTLTGIGYQDTFWVNVIALLMGTAHRIDSVTGRASWNVDDYGPELATAQQVGLVLSNGTVPTQTTTCTQLVNRIPDVIAAPPGLVTVEKLPRLRYRAFPLHTYLPGVK
jgi:hypothetical protein